MRSVSSPRPSDSFKVMMLKKMLLRLLDEDISYLPKQLLLERRGILVAIIE
jgi:hypothetical protein